MISTAFVLCMQADWHSFLEHFIQANIFKEMCFTFAFPVKMVLVSCHSLYNNQSSVVHISSTNDREEFPNSSTWGQCSMLLQQWKCGTCLMATSVVKTAWKRQYFPPPEASEAGRAPSEEEPRRASSVTTGTQAALGPVSGVYVAYICEMDFNAYIINNNNTRLNPFQRLCPTERDSLLNTVSTHMIEC